MIVDLQMLFWQEISWEIGVVLLRSGQNFFVESVFWYMLAFLSFALQLPEILDEWGVPFPHGRGVLFAQVSWGRFLLFW